MFNELTLTPNIWQFPQSQPMFAVFKIQEAGLEDGRVLTKQHLEDVWTSITSSAPGINEEYGYTNLYANLMRYWFRQDTANYGVQAVLGVAGRPNFYGPGPFLVRSSGDEATLEGARVRISGDPEGEPYKRLGGGLIARGAWLSFFDENGAEAPIWVSADAQYMRAQGRATGVCGFVKEGAFLSVELNERQPTAVSYVLQNNIEQLLADPQDLVTYSG